MARLAVFVVLGIAFPLALAAGPLHTAARGGDTEAAAALIAAGADVDERESTGEAPLHIAAGKGDEGCESRMALIAVASFIEFRQRWR